MNWLPPEPPNTLLRPATRDHQSNTGLIAGSRLTIKVGDELQLVDPLCSTTFDSNDTFILVELKRAPISPLATLMPAGSSGIEDALFNIICCFLHLSDGSRTSSPSILAPCLTFIDFNIVFNGSPTDCTISNWLPPYPPLASPTATQLRAQGPWRWTTSADL